MSTLDIHINEGFIPMVDGALVYHRGFGERRTAVTDPKSALIMTPRVFTAGGQVVASRTYPLSAPIPPHGRPQPLRRIRQTPESTWPGGGTGPAISRTGP